MLTALPKDVLSYILSIVVYTEFLERYRYPSLTKLPEYDLNILTGHGPYLFYTRHGPKCMATVMKTLSRSAVIIRHKKIMEIQKKFFQCFAFVLNQGNVSFGLRTKCCLS